MRTDSTHSDNPFAAPVGLTAEAATDQSLWMGWPAKVALPLILMAFEAATAYAGLVAIPVAHSISLLILAECGLLLAAGVCGWRYSFSQYVIPLIVSNFAAWATFVYTVRMLHSHMLTPVSINRNDMYYFAAIAVGSALLIVVVSAFVRAVRQ